MTHRLVTPHASAPMDALHLRSHWQKPRGNDCYPGSPQSKFIFKQLLRLPLCAICLPSPYGAKVFVTLRERKLAGRDGSVVQVLPG